MKARFANLAFNNKTMINFLHTNVPTPILISLGLINIFWYGFFMVLSILLGIGLTIKLAEYYKINKEEVVDLAFWLIVFGILGARAYHVFLELPFYLKHPINIIQVWKGGLAIHGAIFAGLLTTYFFAKKQKINFWQLTALMAPGLALGQTLGRWGNYFNQELFGTPTNLPWGIPINFLNRPPEFFNYEYFHPTFLYESLGNFLIFIILISLHVYILKKFNAKNNKINIYKILTIIYLLLYSILRFFMEFLRTDNTPTILSLRFPQIISLLIILSSFIYFLYLLINYTKDRIKTSSE